MVEVMWALRADLLRNLGNMTNSELHEHFPVVPEPIRGYIAEVKAGLRMVADSPGAHGRENGGVGWQVGGERLNKRAT